MRALRGLQVALTLILTLTLTLILTLTLTLTLTLPYPNPNLTPSPSPSPSPSLTLTLPITRSVADFDPLATAIQIATELAISPAEISLTAVAASVRVTRSLYLPISP